MNSERKGGLTLELSPFNRTILQTQLAEYLSYVWAGPHDRKHSSVNKQISMEELEIRNSLFHLDVASQADITPSNQSSIENAIERAKSRSQVRLGQLTDAWYKEDEKIRRESGASWDDLWEILAPFDIKPVDTSNLKRPHSRAVFTMQENPEWGLSDEYSFASDSKKTAKLYKSEETIEVPAHIVEVFGNEVKLSKEDFDETVQRLKIKSKRVYQISGSEIDSVTYLPIFRYQVVVPYKKWLLVSNEWFYNEKPNYPKDKTQQFKYWDDSLLPEVLVEPNRGSDLIYMGEIQIPDFNSGDNSDN